MLSFECIKNEKSVYFLLTSAQRDICPDIIFCDSKTGKNLIHLNDFGCTG